MKIAVAQLGARRHYAVPCGLAAVNSLSVLITDACAAKPPWSWLRLVPRAVRGSWLHRLEGRLVDALPLHQVRPMPRFWFSELWRRHWQRNGDVAKSDWWAWQNARFASQGCSHIPREVDGVYAYNGAALELFRWAKQRSVQCILDQTAAPWRFNRELLLREMDRWSNWEKEPADLDRSGRMIEREEEEWALADRIICGSQFVVDKVACVGGPADKCRVVRYPSPTIGCVPRRANDDTKHTQPRLLFAGTLQLRKGIQYLKQLADMLDVEVRAVGPSHLTSSAVTVLAEKVEIVGSVPRAEMWSHYKWCDVFVLPTLSEGSANVCHEALAVGVPVVTTNAAGIDGFSRAGVHIVRTDNINELAGSVLKAVAAQPIVDGTLGGKTVVQYGVELLEAICR